MKRLMICVLLLAMLVSMLAACGGDDRNPAVTTGQKQEQMTVPTDEYGRPVIYNPIVEEGIRYDGVVITILHAGEDQSYEPDRVGEKVNDANFSRDMSVETNLGVELEWKFIEYGSSAKTYNNAVKQSISGGKPYSILFTHGYYSAEMAIGGYYANLTQMKYLDFSQPWWTEKTMEEITVNDVAYLASGDMAIDSVACTTCMFYNKNMYSAHYSDINIYDEVFEKRWTLEKFSEMVKEVYLEMDNIPGTSEGDRLGLATSCTSAHADPFLYGFGVRCAEKNANGELEIVLGNELSVNAFADTYKLFRENEGVFFRSGEKTDWTNYEWAYPKFVNSGALFMADCFGATKHLVDMTDRYGVLPTPLLNSSQQEYLSGGVGTLQAIPVNAAELDATAAAMDLLNYYGYQYVVPMYFEKMLKTLYADAPEDAAVYQMLLDARWADFSIVYSFALEDPLWDWRKQLREDSNNISNHWFAQKPIYTQKLQEVFDAFRQLPAA